MTALCLCRSQSELGVIRTRMHVRVCCFHFHPFHLCLCCVNVSSRFSPVPSLALRIGSHDQCDGNQCCPSFGGCLRWHPELTDRLTGGAGCPFSVGGVICLVRSLLTNGSWCMAVPLMGSLVIRFLCVKRREKREMKEKMKRDRDETK